MGRRQQIGARAFGRHLRPFVVLEQRIALQLLLDIGRDFEVGKLQQFDRLTQLGRHDEGLGLTEL